MYGQEKNRQRPFSLSSSRRAMPAQIHERLDALVLLAHDDDVVACICTVMKSYGRAISERGQRSTDTAENEITLLLREHGSVNSLAVKPRTSSNLSVVSLRNNSSARRIRSWRGSDVVTGHFTGVKVMAFEGSHAPGLSGTRADRIPPAGSPGSDGAVSSSATVNSMRPRCEPRQRCTRRE